MLQVIATAPAEITGLVSDASTVWDSVKLIIVGVGVFFVLWRIAKRVAHR